MPVAQTKTKKDAQLESSKPVRLIDIADRVGVSKITVSKVLNGRGGSNTRVSQSMAEKIRKVAQAMNYRPNLVAQQLTGQRAYLIGGILDSLANETYSKRLGALERAAADAGYRLIVGYSHGEVDRIAAHVQDFLGRGVDGIISLSHTYPGQGAEISRLLKSFKNSVLIEPAVGDSSFSYVSPDYVESGYLLTKHLLSLGRKKIAMLQYGTGYQVVQDQLRGYQKALQEVETLFDLNMIIRPNETELAIREATDRNVHRLLEIGADAVITQNDGAAMWVIRGLANRGLRVPDHCAVASLDGWDIGSSYVPSITSVDLNAQDVGKEAIRMLLKKIEGTDEQIQEQEGQKKILSPRLVIGESCGAGRVN